MFLSLSAPKGFLGMRWEVPNRNTYLKGPDLWLKNTYVYHVVKVDNGMKIWEEEEEVRALGLGSGGALRFSIFSTYRLSQSESSPSGW